MKVLFDSLAELVGNIVEGDSRAAYSVGYRGKDFFCLAESEGEAAGAVAMSMGMQVGLVPLDMIVSAARRSAAFGPGAVAIPPPATPAKADHGYDADVFAKMAVADLKEYAGKNGIEIPGKGKTAILEAIEAYHKAKNDPNQAKLPLEGDKEAGK